MRFLSKNKFRTIGFVFFLIYFGQWFVPWDKAGFVEMQEEDRYKLITGSLLFLLILSQWLLTYARVILELDRSKIQSLNNMHKYIGVFSPLFYFVHSCNPGYGLLLVLTIIFMTNHLWASIQGNSHFWIGFSSIWILVHIFLSVMILIISIYHIYLSFAF